MNDFGIVVREWLTGGAVFFLDQTEDLSQFSNGLFSGWHESMTSRYRWDLSDPPVGSIAVDDELVVFEAHASSSLVLRAVIQ
jgi:hypothetical protein